MIKIAIILLLFFSSLFAKDIYLKTERIDNKLYVYLYNNSFHHVTINYKAKIRNLLPLGNLPFTKSYEAKSKNKIFEFLILDSKFSYRASYKWSLGTIDANHNDSYIYRLPFKTGSTHMVSQGYNGKFSHQGNSRYAIDFAMKENTKIYAARSGLVVKVKADSKHGGPHKRYLKDANSVIIKHDDNTYAVYNHLQYKGIKVKVGQRVKRGEFLALSGNTGYSNGPHLHFIVYKLLDENTRQSFPIRFLSKRGIINHIQKGKYYQASK